MVSTGGCRNTTTKAMTAIPKVMEEATMLYFFMTPLYDNG
jgi:hypothetical protein